MVDIPKPTKAPITFVSNPVVQDTSKMDRSADDAANARLAARRKASTPRPAARPTAKPTAAAVSKPTAAAVSKPTAAAVNKPAAAAVNKPAAAAVNKPAAKPAATPSGFGSGASSVPESLRYKGDGAPRRPYGSGAVVVKDRKAGPLTRGLSALAKHAEGTSTPNVGRPFSKAASDTQRKAGENASAHRKAIREAAEKREADRTRWTMEPSGPAKWPERINLAKGGKTESPKMVKKELDFFKKKKAPPSMIKHEEAELKQSKSKDSGKIAKKDNPFAAANKKGKAVPKKKANPFAKARGKNPFGFAKGGKIDGVAKRGHTKCKRT